MLLAAALMVLVGCSSQQREATHKAESKAAAGPEAAAATSDEEKIKIAMSAAPADISRNATIVDPEEGGHMRQLRAGSNGWTCMAKPQVMCLDKEWQSFADAWMNKKDPQVKNVGFAYMLQGDAGASNTDPFATEPTADNHWVVSPPHLMVVTPDRAQLDALPTDPHNGGPWVMWKGTKYAHIMVPTAPMPETK